MLPPPLSAQDLLIAVLKVFTAGLGILAVVVLLRARWGPRGKGVSDAQAAATGRGLWEGLQRSRDQITGRLAALFTRGPRTGEVFEGIEEVLLGADVGARTARVILDELHHRWAADAPPGEGVCLLASVLRERLLVPPPTRDPGGRLHVTLVVGVNGVGKTTSVAKLAYRCRRRGAKVLVVAADTFRAAAGEQLAVWAERAGADCVAHSPGGDPSAVVFDGLRAARSRGQDVVIIDTAGRLHTKRNLLEELRKIRRVIAAEDPSAPHETLLVLDATTGQNGLAQARTFQEALGLTGVLLTKLDGTAKGGIVFAIGEELRLPVCYVGTGEGIADIAPFDPEEFVRGLLAAPPAGGASTLDT